MQAGCRLSKLIVFPCWRQRAASLGCHHAFASGRGNCCDCSQLPRCQLLETLALASPLSGLLGSDGAKSKCAVHGGLAGGVDTFLCWACSAEWPDGFFGHYSLCFFNAAPMHTRNMTEVSTLTMMPAARTGQRTGGRARVLCSSKIAMTTCTSICWSREGQPISRASYGRGALSVSVTSVARACSDQPDLFVLSATCCASSTMLTSNLRRERSTSFRCWLGRTARLSRWDSVPY